MCKEFEIARKVVAYYAVCKNSFTTEDIKKEIDSMGGVYMVSSRESIYDFLDDFVKKGDLYYDEIKDKYYKKISERKCMC